MPLHRKRNWRIAFFVPSNFEYVSRLADGVLRYQTDRSNCIVRDFRYDSGEAANPEVWANRPWPWADWRPDGLIVNVAPDPGLAEWVIASGVPAVNTCRDSSQLPAVHLSYDGIAHVAIEHFQSLGFKHFAFVGCNAIDSRFDAFESRLKSKGLPLSMMNYGNNPTHWDAEIESKMAGSDGLDELLRSAPKPLAILAATDDVGRVVCRAAMKLGLKIPLDVAVLGVNNLSPCRTCDPPLSSIHAPGEDVGYRAMEILMAILHGRPVPFNTQVEPGKVYARASTIGERAREADLTNAMEVIRDQACSGISVNEVVEELNMSRSTLDREFISTFGRSPSKEIARVRLARAKELLGKTRTPIRRIANMLGYPTPANFTTFFKTQTGITPMAFRIGGRAATRGQ